MDPPNNAGHSCEKAWSPGIQTLRQLSHAISLCWRTRVYPSILFHIHHRDIYYSTEDAFGGFGCFIDNAFGISDRFP